MVTSLSFAFIQPATEEKIPGSSEEELRITMGLSFYSLQPEMQISMIKVKSPDKTVGYTRREY
jgi:hypothetical protein